MGIVWWGRVLAYHSGMEDPPSLHIRISDAERDRAMAALGEHLATGRLELDEYDARCTRTVGARTRADLEALFADLPEPHPDLSTAVPPKRAATKAVATGSTNGKAHKDLAATPGSEAMETIAGLTLLLGLPAAILLTILAGMWWLFFPVTGVFVVTAAMSEALKKPKS